MSLESRLGAGATALAHRVILSWGWRRAAIAFLAGALGALAMPPFGVWPVLAVSFPVAVWLVDGSAGKGGRLALRGAWSAAGAGWCFGFGYFVAGLWWLGAAFLVEAETFAWLMPLGVIGLPALLAFFPALGFAACRFVWPRGEGRVFLFAAVMALAEWLRGHVLTGFPWNSFGLAFGAASPLDQGAAIVGMHGLTLLVLLVLAAPAVIGTGETPRRRWTLPAFALLLGAGLAGYGWWRVPSAASPVLEGVTLRIMQPDIPQDSKFRPEAKERILAHYLALSDRATSSRIGGVGDVTHLLWPESAFPFILDRDPAAMERLAAFLPDNVTLVTGAARAEAALPGEQRARFFNAIHVIDGKGSILDTYDKTHLVPFGEYLPLRRLFDALGLRQFIAVPGGFTPGRERKRLVVPGLPPVVALICYEAIFPAEAVAESGARGLIVNVTNDAWFGLTPGPHQHFAQARMRAIEQGVPLVRAANNGVSAVVDPYGRVIARLPSGAGGVMDSSIPRAVAHTIYARFHDSAFFALVVLFFMVAHRLR